MRRRLHVHTALLAAALALVPGAAAAVRVAGTATGVIDENAQTAGEGGLVFGLEGSALLGQPFRIDFAYDTELAPPDTESHPQRAELDSNDPALDWLDLAITVNGRTVVLGGNHRVASVLDSTPDDWLALGIESSFTAPDGSSRQELLAFTVFVAPDSFSGDALPTVFSTTEITRAFNSAAFRIDDFDVDPDSGALLYQRYVEFNLDIREIAAQVVPEPAIGGLVAAGLLAVALARRRHRRVAA